MSNPSHELDPTLESIAYEIRSKNAGPFWVTLEAFMKDDAGYSLARELITPALIGSLYQVPEADVQLFHLDSLRIVKVSFPRRVGQASLHDADVHAGQQHVLLGSVELPDSLRALS